MLSVIRTCPSRVKYCGRTVDNLIESNGGEYHPLHIISTNKTPNENGLLALREGMRLSNGLPFIFLEDDLAFIREFSRSAQDFEFNCRGNDSLILPLCAAYKDALVATRGLAWRYPVSSFYGTQAFVIEPHHAADLIAFAEKEQPMHKRGFDLLIKRWAEARRATHFLTPYKCFVQHIGVESAMHNGRFHHYAAWPGRDWTYRTGAFNLKEQTNRPCDKPLAKAIATWFGNKLPAYDLGCSTGQYVAELGSVAGIHGIGFDATPGIARRGEALQELDLARPQTFTEKPGNVMCLEVAEHIHAEDEPHLLANLKALCADKLVLSWAPPGQGGRRHVNERPAADVVALLKVQGFKWDQATTDRLRSAAAISWFKDSLYAFQRA